MTSDLDVLRLPPDEVAAIRARVAELEKERDEAMKRASYERDAKDRGWLSSEIQARELASSRARVAELEAALRLASDEICRHESTHRGGAIWTICDECGEQWADDRGGFRENAAANAVDAALARSPSQAAERLGALEECAAACEAAEFALYHSNCATGCGCVRCQIGAALARLRQAEGRDAK